MNEPTPIFLTTEESAKFILYMKNYDFIETILASGMLNLKNGSATLDFNKDGVLMDIVLKTQVYNRNNKVSIG